MDNVDFIAGLLDRDELVRLIEYHNHRYWDEGSPEISDEHFDELMRALRDIDPDNELLNRVYSPQVESTGKVRHEQLMLSLDKAYTLSEVLDWAKKFARNPEELLLVEPKYDGISADFDGKILSTRGNGEWGENISAKLPLVELETLGYTGKVDRPVRGELLIRDDDFKTLYSHIRRKDGAVYKNSRNAVAGIMGLKDISGMVRQGAKITLVDYNLYSFKVPLSELKSKWEELSRKLEQLPYPQDGIVLKLADEAYAASLGNTAHHPRGEIAFKFTNIRRESKLLNVEWSFGKNCLTPVAEFEPIEISGVTIRRATLHNLQNILELGVQIGDSITVERAGDVIPYICSCTPGSNRRSAIIENCPSCGSKLVRRGPELCCPNPDCPETSLARLAAAVRNLGIERLGEPTLRKLVERFGVRHLGDLFELTAVKLLQIEGFAAKSAANLVGEIQKAREVDDFKLLAALNIPNIGVNVAKVIFKYTDFAGLRQMPEEKLAAIPGIGPERARALLSELNNQSDYLNELLGAVQLRHQTESNESGPSICFTGKMPEKRSYYEQLAKSNGYKIADDVSAGLTLLVAADLTGSSSKLKKAAKYGVKTISLEEFLANVADSSAEDSLPLL